MKKSLFAILMVMGLLGGCVASNETANPQETQAQAQKSVAQGIWIDVRGADEFATGHLVGASNITPDNIATQITTLTADKNTPINLYCRSGRRAEAVRSTLLELGYQNVINHGGFDDIKDKYLTSLDK
ncbi:MAG: rhodanese-like domain-containing protein [Moraxella sp.]|nr:rhodanese-like domain-containing protein [Moraxella sp.]